MIIPGVLVEDRSGESLDMVSSWCPGDLVVEFGSTDTTSGKLATVTGKLVIISRVLVEDHSGESLDMVSNWCPHDLVVEFGVTQILLQAN